MARSFTLRHLNLRQTSQMAFASSSPLPLNFNNSRLRLSSSPFSQCRHVSSSTPRRPRPDRASTIQSMNDQPRTNQKQQEKTPPSTSTKQQTTPKYLRSAATGALSNVTSAERIINWYPGHIAKAERALRDSIKMVDVVLEVRDSRIPLSTTHPSVSEWLGPSRTRLLVLNRADLTTESARTAWKQHYLTNTAFKPYFVNSKQGRGVRELKKAAIQAGFSMNEKRKSKGLLPRPVRCLVMGYPNVGKSALINKLVGKNTAKSANKPGVTRNYQWIRISQSIELLDMPGIIPAKFITQEQALRLAICDDIGQAAYDTQIVAAKMIDEVYRISIEQEGYFDIHALEKRFGVEMNGSISGEEYLCRVADKVSKGDLERTSVRLLTEFRAGVLGKVALEAPDMMENNQESETEHWK